jgi:hypothetical protein
VPRHRLRRPRLPPTLKNTITGHWSFWCAKDRAWYYTDGHHWFLHDGKKWVSYKFDKSFGREGFEKGEYKVPGKEVEVFAPRHEVRHY